MLQIDSEFKSLIPKIADEEYRILEESLLSEGCRDSLAVWIDPENKPNNCTNCHENTRGYTLELGALSWVWICESCGHAHEATETIIDGHNRYEICQQHDIEYDTCLIDLDSRDDAKIWIIRNQFGRRNLSMFQRSELALTLKPLLSAKAKENQIRKPESVPKNSWESTQEFEIKAISDDKGFSYDTKINLINAVKAKYGRERKKLTYKAEETAYIAITANKIKIGVSVNPAARIDQFKTSDPDIALIDVFSNGRELESLLLKKFKAISLGGEWLAFTEENLKKILDYAWQEDARLNETSVQVAKIAGVSHDTIAKVEKIKEKASPETIQSIRDCDLTVNKAFTEIKREEKRQEIKEKVTAMELPTGKYRIIYADPPWSYGNTMPEYFTEQKDHYPTMTIQELCDLPIKDLSEDSAVLFLWVTSPILEEAFQVINAWGFKYKSSFVWDKESHNMGHYNSVRHELLLICTKGSCMPDVNKLHDSVVSIKRTEHSKKPDYFRTLIESLYTYGNKIELFSRVKNSGWAVFGNEL